MAPRVVAGFDPDHTGSALVVADLKAVRWAEVIQTDAPYGLPSVKAQLHRMNKVFSRMLDECAPDEIVIECPVDYEFNREARPNDLITLGMISSALAARCDYEGVEFQLVYAREWKGGQKKGVNQALTLEHYQIPFRQPANLKQPCRLKKPFAECFSSFPAGTHGELFDALGMALWRLAGGQKARWLHRPGNARGYRMRDRGRW